MPIITENFDSQNKLIYIFRDKEILLQKNTNKLPDSQLFESLKSKNLFSLSFYDSCTDSIGALLNKDFDSSSAVLNPSEFSDYNFIPLRQYFYISDEEKAALSARLRSYLDWLLSTKYCCTCGEKLQLYTKENALYCPRCNKIHYPRIEPCIIVLIRKEDKVLLLRHAQRNQDIYTCLAGFIEVGESIEQAVYREVKEEVGLEITNLKYVGSQGWPFPDQLMLAFYADYKSGELVLQEEEISQAEWLNPAEVTNIPQPGSVAWKLINNQF